MKFYAAMRISQCDIFFVVHDLVLFILILLNITKYIYMSDYMSTSTTNNLIKGRSQEGNKHPDFPLNKDLFNIV